MGSALPTWGVEWGGTVPVTLIGSTKELSNPQGSPDICMGSNMWLCTCHQKSCRLYTCQIPMGSMLLYDARMTWPRPHTLRYT